jgi:hypothetical protein
MRRVRGCRFLVIIRDCFSKCNCKIRGEFVFFVPLHGLTKLYL